MPPMAGIAQCRALPSPISAFIPSHCSHALFAERPAFSLEEGYSRLEMRPKPSVPRPKWSEVRLERGIRVKQSGRTEEATASHIVELSQSFFIRDPDDCNHITIRCILQVRGASRPSRSLRGPDNLPWEQPRTYPNPRPKPGVQFCSLKDCSCGIGSFRELLSEPC
jgi:hypothetical protein